MSEVLAIIPARSGSKGIPQKNFRHLHGITPVQRAVDCCRSAHVPCVVITDYERAHHTNWNYLYRPAELAQDDTPMIDVVRDVLARIPGPEDQIILLVQPTQPLRDPKHLKAAITVMDEDGWESVVSVVRTEPAQKHVFVNDYGHLVLHDERVERRQDAREAYKCDGTVYAFRRRSLDDNAWFTQPCRPLFIPKSETCELDTPDDWAIAEVRLAAKEAMQRA